MGGILGDDLGEGNCESKTVSRQWGDDFCRETSICLAGPSGQSVDPEKDGGKGQDLAKGGRRNGVTSDFFGFFPCFLPFFFVFLPFSVFFRFSVSFTEENGETPFARPLLRNPERGCPKHFTT